MISDEARTRSSELLALSRRLHREACDYVGWWVALRRRCRERSQPINEDACDEIERAECRVKADAALLEAQAYLLRCGESSTNVVVLST